jgi:hypothetical protein
MSKLLEHPEIAPIARYTSRARLDKSINGLLGIIEGISLDRTINDREIGFLNAWLDDHADVVNKHPYNELIPLVSSSLNDARLTEEEKLDIRWLCEKLKSTDFTNAMSADLQRLHAIVGGIAADGEVNEDELRELSNWLQEHEHLKSCWPYDEIDTLVTSVMRDGKIDSEEHAVLKAYFSEFVHKRDDRTITSPPILEGQTVLGLCAVCPDIVFEGSTFCFTGASTRFTRNAFLAMIEQLGGRGVTSVSPKVNYLVIGAEGNPCWMYACYGRKVEKAIELRKSGVRILIVHENDFHDAVADHR